MVETVSSNLKELNGNLRTFTSSFSFLFFLLNSLLSKNRVEAVIEHDGRICVERWWEERTVYFPDLSYSPTITHWVCTHPQGIWKVLRCSSFNKSISMILRQRDTTLNVITMFLLSPIFLTTSEFHLVPSLKWHSVYVIRPVPRSKWILREIT